MAEKTFDRSEESRRAILRGVNWLADTAKLTLGAKSRNAVIKRRKPGEIELSDPFENMGAQMVREVTSKTAEMAGDGTTTATILAQSIFEEGSKRITSGANPMALKRGIEKAAAVVSDEVLKQAKVVISSEMVAQVATAEAGGDRSIGAVVAEAIKAVGKDGVVTVEESKALTMELVVAAGVQLERGYLSPYFITDTEEKECVLVEPYILLAEGKIAKLDGWLPLLEQVMRSGKPLLVIAQDVEGEALATLVINRIRGNLKVCAVKAPGYGERRKEMLADLAAVTGGIVMAEEAGAAVWESARLEQLGKARRVIIGQHKTTIIEPAGEAGTIAKRAGDVFAEMAAAGDDYSRGLLRQRLDQLAGRVATIQVGAATERELAERMPRTREALHAVRLATEEGVVPGGGVALLRAAGALQHLRMTGDEQAGVEIVRSAIEAPMRALARNAGFDEAAVVTRIRREERDQFGLNVRTGQYEDLWKAGVIDPAKVTRSAILNAASLSAQLLTTRAMDVGDRPGALAMGMEDNRSVVDTFSQMRGTEGLAEKIDTPQPLIPGLGGGPNMTPNPEFYFILKGDGVERDQFQYATDADLIFNYDALPAEALAWVSGEKLEAIRKTQNGVLEIYISLTGLELREGGMPYAQAQFLDGALVKPVSFPLRAPAGGPLQADARIDVRFSVRGALIYAFPLSIRLVKEIDHADAQRQRVPLDLDELSAQDRKTRHAQLFIDDVKTGYRVTYVHQSEVVPSIDVGLTDGKLTNALNAARTKLKGVATDGVWNGITKDLDAPSDQASLRAQMDVVLSAGWQLYEVLAATPFKAVLDKIESLEDGSTLAVSTKEAVIPWEILFSLQYDESWDDAIALRSANFKPERMWGNRFQIETKLLLKEEAVIPRPRQPDPLSVSMVIGDTVAPQPNTPAAEAVQWQKDYFQGHLTSRGELAQGKAQVQPIFTAPDYAATFIYLLCHGQSVDANTPADALEISANYHVGPNALITSNLYTNYPIVFLNSCASGAISPMVSTSFLEKFRQKGACGVIATSFTIPTRFAVAFGSRVLDGYLSGEPLGEIFLSVRRALMDKNVPLGLFYTLQCPVDVLPPKGNVTA